MCGVPLLVLDLGLDIVDGVRGLNLEGDGLTREAARDEEKLISDPLDAPENNSDSRLDEDLHLCRRSCLSNELNGGVVDRSAFWPEQKKFCRRQACPRPCLIARQRPVCGWSVRLANKVWAEMTKR